MLLAGDEFARTQNGNNAYCQDSGISWVNWTRDADAQALLAFTKDLIKLRQTYPVLRRSRFLTGAHDETLDVRDLAWINANGGEMQQVHWDDPNTRCLGMLIDGRAQKTGIRKRGDDATLRLVMNGYRGDSLRRYDLVRSPLPAPLKLPHHLGRRIGALTRRGSRAGIARTASVARGDATAPASHCRGWAPACRHGARVAGSGRRGCRRRSEESRPGR